MRLLNTKVKVAQKRDEEEIKNYHFIKKVKPSEGVI